MDIYDLINQKGGVGKTASTIGLGGALADAGERVLLVDLDPQGHLTDALGGTHVVVAVTETLLPGDEARR